MTYRSFITLPVALTIAASLSACGEGSRPEGFTATLPPPPVAAYGVPQTADGAIFNVSQGYAPLYNGNRASQVGDLVTIVLIERTSTSKATSAKTQRDGNAGLTLPDFVGIDQGDPAGGDDAGGDEVEVCDFPVRRVREDNGERDAVKICMEILDCHERLASGAIW